MTKERDLFNNPKVPKRKEVKLGTGKRSVPTVDKQTILDLQSNNSTVRAKALLTVAEKVVPAIPDNVGLIKRDAGFVREAVYKAFDDAGGHSAFAVWASENPSEFYRLFVGVGMGTPKGKNNFWRMVERAVANPDRYFYLCLKASETGHLQQTELDEARLDMDEDEYLREFECSFEAAVQGTYFNKELLGLLNRTHNQDVNEPVKWDPVEKVECAFDLGRRDACAVWFWQTINGEVRFIDYFEETGRTADDMVEYLQFKPYSYSTWWLPHDAEHETFATQNSVLDTFLAAGAPARKVPNPDKGNRVFHGIDIARKALKRMPLRFALVKCFGGLEAIKNYRRKWDADMGVYSDTPIHDRWSHGADAFRYACQCINADTIQASVERAREREEAKQLKQTGINIRRMTFDEAFAAREREMERHGRNSGRAYD